MKLKSFAKINLTLDILGKRPDGYHEIETIFQQIDLHDDIEITTNNSEKIEIECNWKKLENTDNLAYRAAMLLRDTCDVEYGATIKITKRIPAGAGLGGGSSNAATTLTGLNTLWNLGLNQRELIDISKRIGMDVAFNVLGGTCLGTGRGEHLTKIPNFKAYLVIVDPGFPISTKESYNNLDLTRLGRLKTTKRFLVEPSMYNLHNDFEESIFLKYPEIEKIKNNLGPNSLLSGSGSCIFGLFEEAVARKKYAELKNVYPQIYLTRTIDS